jgi:hypothetical protein
MQGYLTHTSLQMTRIFLVLACFHRYALSSSNAYIRKFTHVVVARRIVAIVIIGCYLIAIHLVIYLFIQNNGCTIYNHSTMIYNSIYSITIISITIPILMLTFSMLTFYNLKKHQSRCRQLRQQPLDQRRKLDQRVIFISMIQLALYFVSTVLYAPNIIYGTTTQTIPNKSFDRQTIESFINSLAVSLIYLYPSLSFFAFTFVSKTFRKELIKIIYSLFSYHHPENKIAPLIIIAFNTLMNS